MQVPWRTGPTPLVASLARPPGEGGAAVSGTAACELWRLGEQPACRRLWSRPPQRAGFNWQRGRLLTTALGCRSAREPRRAGNDHTHRQNGRASAQAGGCRTPCDALHWRH